MNSNQHISPPRERGWHEFVFVLVLAVFLAESTFAKDGAVKGEVFIVTQGAQNVRLGLVEIAAFPEDVIQKHIEERKAHVADEMPDFDKDIKGLDEVIAQTKETIEKLKALSDQKFALNRKTGQGNVGLVERMEDRKSLEPFEKILGVYESEKKRRVEAKKNWPASRHFFKNLPESKTSTRTSSDGKFSLAVPEDGKFALVAHATRKTLEATEEYYWMIWVSLDGKDSKEVILGNHNLMSAGSKESVVSTKSD